MRLGPSLRQLVGGDDGEEPLGQGIARRASKNSIGPERLAPVRLKSASRSQDSISS